MMDPKLRKRLYIRQKQRLYRKKIVDEIEMLREQSMVLEKQVAYMSAKKGTMLSWENVAKGLEEDVLAAKQTECALKEKRKGYLDLIASMVKWIALQKGIQTSVALPVHTWRNVTLLAGETTRKLGFDWITKNVHYNTNRMLQQYDFPALNSPETILDFTVDMADLECLQYILRCQRELPIPLEYVVPAIREHVIQFLVRAQWNYEDLDMQEKTVEELDVEDDDDTMTYTSNTISDEEVINYLTREFHTENQVIFVGQNIHQDELLPKCKRQSNRTFWFILDRMEAFKTKLRVLYTTSHYFTSEGYVSLMDEAKYWGCDLDAIPEAKQTAKFHQYVMTMGQEFARHGEQQIQLAFQ
ncbi:hypothetical protein THRCLA_11395 [Thraustotheca clavata]|uniref:Uncharacterized protein n=1 Tax=Thraustotheca clavata TaxID=74557 RepID=A0A1V9Y7U5_9STRA|nr:hypothetical protein THRCLA_11395 [Thraustotheca clavata]